ncbi:DUF5709 domain-containing protein [Nonomuraea sp. NPDC003727]|uniref:DUF5709 domain-containing protein n=1 Tax=Nonomuraea sp. NPDC003804 TaxID=3154547 RepID=UPI0033BDA852
MSQQPPDRYGLSDEQEIEVEGWTEDLGREHVIEEDDPRHQDTVAERMWREAPERDRTPREEHRLVAPDEGLAPDVESEEVAEEVGADSGDLSAEERAIRIERDLP